MSDTTLPVASGDGGNMNIGLSDPNKTSPMESQGGGRFAGKETPLFGDNAKKDSDLSGLSGKQQGSYYDQSIPSMMERMPTMAPSGENSSGIPAAQPIDPLTFGDPNNTATDKKDNYIPSGPEVDTKRYGFAKVAIE